MTPRVYCGTFEAETYWREQHLAKLPSVPDRNSSRMLEAMDEVLSLQRIAKYLSGQTASGKRVRFILEPYLPKSSEFS
jgi:hypothetical protein